MEQNRKQNAAVTLVGRAVQLIDLVDYQADAVVSRTILSNKSGTVTLFAFDEGQGLSEHTAPFDALVHVLEGETEITISGNKLHAQEGEMVIMPAKQPHALNATTRFKMMLIMIRDSS